MRLGYTGGHRDLNTVLRKSHRDKKNLITSKFFTILIIRIFDNIFKAIFFMKCFIFLILQLSLSLLLIAQPIRFKVVKWESKWLSDNWETIYKPGDDGSITGLIDTAYKNITIDYRIPNTDGQDTTL